MLINADRGPIRSAVLGRRHARATGAHQGRLAAAAARVEAPTIRPLPGHPKRKERTLEHS